jgi:diacylglycerol kinase family enzyme
VAAAAARVPVLLNTTAGLQGIDAVELQRRLGPDIADVRAVEPAAFADAISDAIASGASVVGIAGGDGSMRAAAAVLSGSSTALACIPTGTLNHFAQRVGIRDLEDAAAALRRGEVHVMSVGSVQDTVFLNTLTFGEYSRVVRMRERMRSYIGKWPAAAVAFTIALLSLRRIRVRLSVADETVTRRTPFVWIGVGWGSFPRVHASLERRSAPDLEVAVLRSATTAGGLGFLLRLAARLVLGRQPVRDSALDVLHTRQLTLDSSHRIDATADGEVLRLRPPVHVGVRDDALRVLTGPWFGKPANET